MVRLCFWSNGRPHAVSRQTLRRLLGKGAEPLRSGQSYNDDSLPKVSPLWSGDWETLIQMRTFKSFFMLTLCSVLVGCGAEVELGGTTAVTGTVNHNGQPVEGATVTFSPAGEGRAASGITDANGRFTLTTLASNDGAMPGTYQVGISKTEVQGAMTAEESEAYLKQHNQPPPRPVSKDMLPAKYKNPMQSGLTATVNESGENDFTFDLAG